MERGPHILLSSESGTGKSSFAATIIQSRNEKPVLVQLFDASDCGTPYRKRANRVEFVAAGGDWPYCDREFLFRDDKHLATIERWHERQGRGSPGITMSGGAKVGTARYVHQGEKWQQYLERMRDFVDEAPSWYALIHDSSTFAEHAVRSYLTGVMKVADGQMIWAQATDELETFYLATFPDLPITTILIAHAVPQKVRERDAKGRVKMIRGEAGDVPYEVRLPGRLGNDIFAAFGEVYRGYTIAARDPETQRPITQFYMQTRPDGVWRCKSQLGVSDPLGPSPHWKDVFAAATGAGAC